MVYLLNACDSCKTEYIMESAEDVFCPHCGAKVTLSSQVQAIKSGSDAPEIERLKKLVLERDIIIKNLNLSINEINEKHSKEISAYEDMCRTKDDTVLGCETQIVKLLADIDFYKEKSESKDGRVSRRQTDDADGKDIYMNYLESANRRKKPLPDTFKRKYLDIDENDIKEGAVGIGTSVYMREKEGGVFEIYPNEMIIAPEMRDTYKKLFDLTNDEDGIKVINIIPGMMRAADAGYYNLIIKGKVIFG